MTWYTYQILTHFQSQHYCCHNHTKREHLYLTQTVTDSDHLTAPSSALTCSVSSVWELRTMRGDKPGLRGGGGQHCLSHRVHVEYKQQNLELTQSIPSPWTEPPEPSITPFYCKFSPEKNSQNALLNIVCISAPSAH